MWRVSRIDFYAAVDRLGRASCLLGILQGILLAAFASVVLLLIRASRPNVGFLGRVPGTGTYADATGIPGMSRCRASLHSGRKASFLYINAETVMDTVLAKLRRSTDIRLVVCDLSSSPFIDLAGSKMLHDLHRELSRAASPFSIVGARGQVRDVLRADGLAAKD